MYLEPTSDPIMNPEIHLPTLQGSIEPSSDYDSNGKVESIEDAMIQAILRIISLNCHLTIMFHEQGSGIFMDEKLSAELMSLFQESNDLMRFVAQNVEQSQGNKP